MSATCATDLGLPTDARNAALDPEAEFPGTTIAELVELILKRRGALESLIRRPGVQALLVPKFLAISLAGFLFFGVAAACATDGRPLGSRASARRALARYDEPARPRGQHPPPAGPSRTAAR